MKKSNKQSLAKRGVIVAGRTPLTPGASAHKDDRRPDRNARKREAKRQIITLVEKSHDPDFRKRPTYAHVRDVIGQVVDA